MIPQETIDQVRQTADIVQVIGEYVRLKKRGRNYLALCPFHTEKTPSFSVSPDKQIYHCFGCGKGGNVFSFLMEHEKMTFVEAVRYLARRCNIPIREERGSDQRREAQERVSYANQVALEYFRKTLSVAKYARVVDGYLRGKRELTAESIEQFQLGLAGEEWDGLIRFAAGRDLTPQDLERAGLALRSEKKGNYFDRFRYRLIFPIFNLSQKSIAFGGRTLKKGEPAKYVNSPETPLYSKSNVLYGLNFAKDTIREKGTAIVVEGYLDVISLWQVDLHNVVASSGTAFTAQQARLLARFADNVLLFFDADSAGQQAALRSVDALYDAGLEVKIMIPPEGEDPDSTARKMGREKVEELAEAALDYISFRTRGLSMESTGIIGKEKLVKEMAELAAKIADPTRRALFRAAAADALEVDQRILQEIRAAAPTEAGPDPASRFGAVELQLLSLLFHEPGDIATVLQSLSAEDFDSKRLARLYAALTTQYTEQRTVDAGALVEAAHDPEFASLVTEVASLDWPPGVVDRELEKLLGEMLARKRRRIRERLGRELAQAEAAGDQEKADQLVAEIRRYE